uniref:Uncharacterized protein n=1 Tax=Eutreptiella gymnastica TaxID=73025 RepID=A0A7S1N6E7_9EUGL|mmetsp:Transcript_127074/g.219895  ORF Transcript_127074/g.219895 Transcript_127074/m.219895 type:complete len:237 (+) Transcript_127074:279-989(+)
MFPPTTMDTGTPHFLSMSEDAQKIPDDDQPHDEENPSTQEMNDDYSNAEVDEHDNAEEADPQAHDQEIQKEEVDEEEEDEDDAEYDEEGEESEEDEDEEEEETEKGKKKKAKWYDNLDKDVQLQEINQWVHGRGVQVPLSKFCWTDKRGQTRELKQSRITAITNSIKANGILKHATCQVLFKKGMCITVLYRRTPKLQFAPFGFTGTGESVHSFPVSQMEPSSPLLASITRGSSTS